MATRSPDGRRAAAPARRAARWRRLALPVLLCLAAAPCRAETLEDVLSIAYGNNPTLLAERAQLEGTNEGVPQALANWRPTVTVTLTGGKDAQEIYQGCTLAFPEAFGRCFILTPQPTHLVTKDKLYQSTYDVTISEPIYRGGRTTAQTSRAYNLVNAERANLAVVEQTVFLNVVTDFLAVIENVEFVALNKENEDVLRKDAEATETRYHLGELTRTDFNQADAAFAAAAAQRKEAEGQLDAARAAYLHDVGEAAADLVKPAAVPELPATLDEAEAVAASAAPSVVQAQYSLQAAEDTVDLVRGQLLPTVTAEAEMVKSSDVEAFGAKQTDKRIVAKGTMPIYEGGAIYAQSRQAQKVAEGRQQQLDDARRAAVQAAKQAWDQLKAARDSLADDERAVADNDKAVSGLEEEVRVGTRTVQDVLLQQQSLFQAELNLVQGQHDVLLNEFTLVAAVGRLTARSLALPVDYYDPEKHLDAVRDKWLGFQTDP